MTFFKAGKKKRKIDLFSSCSACSGKKVKLYEQAYLQMEI